MIDAQLVFDGTFTTSPPAGAAITVTRDSTNVIDLLAARDLGAGSVLGVNVHVTEAFATCTSLQVDLRVSSAAGGTYFSLLLGNVYPVAQLIVGAPLFRYAMPLNQLLNATAGVLKAPGQFVKLVYTIAGADATAGKVISFIAPVNDRNQYYTYPSAYVTH